MDIMEWRDPIVLIDLKITRAEPVEIKTDVLIFSNVKVVEADFIKALENISDAGWRSVALRYRDKLGAIEQKVPKKKFRDRLSSLVSDLERAIKEQDDSYIQICLERIKSRFGLSNV